MIRSKRTRHLRLGLVLGLAVVVLAVAQSAFGATKPPAKPGTTTAAADQYKPATVSFSVTQLARKIGECKRTVTRRTETVIKACKTGRCRTKALHDDAAAKRQCDKLTVPR